MLLEGIQICEARILLEEALTDDTLRKQLGDELATRCQSLLDERTRHLIWSDEANTNGGNHSTLPRRPLGLDWYTGSGLQGRLSQFYAAAAEVSRILKR